MDTKDHLKFGTAVYFLNYMKIKYTIVVIHENPICNYRYSSKSTGLNLFDVGVANTMARRGEIKAKSELFGKAFEHFIIQELRAYLSYSRSRCEMCYWRSTSMFEVDVVLGQEIAIKIKATQIDDRQLKGLRALREEGMIKRFVAVSLDEKVRITKDEITIYPWKDFLAKLWSGELLVDRH